MAKTPPPHLMNSVMTAEEQADMLRQYNQAAMNQQKQWATQAAQGAISGNPLIYDPRANLSAYNAVVSKAEHRTVITEDLAARIDYMERRTAEALLTAKMAREDADNVSQFYKWLMLAYPDILAQYKALKELEAACREQEAGQQLPVQP